MVKLANQFSFLFLTIPIVLLALFFLLRGEGSRLKQLLALLLVAFITLIFFWVQPGKNEINSEESNQILARATTPVLLEIYSDFWLACMRAEPIVNGLKEDWKDEVLVLQLNIHQPANERLIKQLDAQFTPTFVLLDKSGDEIWRQVGAIDANEARQQVALLEQWLRWTEREVEN